MEKKISKGVKKQLLSALFLIALVALTLFLVLQSNKELSWENIVQFLSDSNPWILVVAFVCMLLFIFFEGLSLHIINARLGYKKKLISSMVYASADVYYSALTPSASGGQPASAYYMVKDGIDGGVTTFALVFNLICYTSAIIVIAVASLVMDAIIGWEFFSRLEGLSLALLIVGLVLQSILLVFFILCMRCHGAVLKVGNWGISLLTKMKIIKKTEKWRNKLAGAVEKYKRSYGHIQEHKDLFVYALLLNVAQRVSQMLVSSFVCLAVAPDTNFIHLFIMQGYVMIGYNSIPLPGGVGAFEFMFLTVYGMEFAPAFVTSAMMVSRVISYYLCMIFSGVLTLSYHVSIIRRKMPEVSPLAEGAGDADEIVEDGEEEIAENEELQEAEDTPTREPSEQTEEKREEE